MKYLVVLRTRLHNLKLLKPVEIISSCSFSPGRKLIIFVSELGAKALITVFIEYEGILGQIFRHLVFLRAK